MAGRSHARPAALPPAKRRATCAQVLIRLCAAHGHDLNSWLTELEIDPIEEESEGPIAVSSFSATHRTSLTGHERKIAENLKDNLQARPRS